MSGPQRAASVSVKPRLSSAAAFFVLFWAMPNCRVVVRHALIGALVTMIAFQGAIGLFREVVSNSSMQVIYGTFAAVPLFLSWLYLCWTLVLGGAVAAGIAGPGRAWRGGARDAVLGVQMINGLGERLNFGGQVMKNVAGFDVSRLQAGAFGMLGLLLEVSLKVLPLPQSEQTLRLELDAADAHARMLKWTLEPQPITATAWHDGALWVRLSGAEAAVSQAGAAIGGELQPDNEPQLRDLLKHLGDLDLVLVEGYKHGSHPRLELRRPGVEAPELAVEDPSICAIVSDGPVERSQRVAVIAGCHTSVSSGARAMRWVHSRRWARTKPPWRANAWW